MAWTDERVELLTKLWKDGFSASQIAGKLGGVSRNAVIGKVHRLGLSGRGAPSKTKTTIRKPSSAMKSSQAKTVSPSAAAERPAPRQERPSPKLATVDGVKAPPTHIPENPEQDVARVKLLDLQPGQCKWPCGDPQTDTFGFCGLPKVPGLPYCEAHAARAFVQSRKDDAKQAMRRASAAPGRATRAARG